MLIDSESQQPTFGRMSPVKRSYRAPCLVLYGDVRVLTQAGGSLTPNEQGANINSPSCSSGPNGAGHAKPCVPSDRRLKENVVQVGVHHLGIGIYLFDYKPEFRTDYGHARQFGVMADEVESVMPDAVVVHPAGFKMVNYGLLGIRRELH